MKKRTKIFLVMGSIFLLCLTGCGGAKQVEGSLSDIMDSLYKGLDKEKTPVTENIEVQKENMMNYLGTDEIEAKEILAREPLINSIAHSVILVRAQKEKDVDTIKKQIKENINPRKWICVGVEEKDVIIKNKGDLIITIVIEDKELREKISQNFDRL